MITALIISGFLVLGGVTVLLACCMKPNPPVTLTEPSDLLDRETARQMADRISKRVKEGK